MKRALQIFILCAWLLSCLVAYKYGHTDGYVKACNELTWDAKSMTQIMTRARVALEHCRDQRIVVQDLD